MSIGRVVVFFVIALALTGLFLLFLEFFLPGAIMAIGGSLLLLASMVVFYLTFDSGLSLFIYFLSLLAAVYLVIQLALWQIKSSEKL